MMDNECEVPPLRVIRVRSNGKRDFDPRDKRQLVEACLRPGVSVSGMALKVGIKTNQLRKWIQLHQVANETAATDRAEPALPAFVPVALERLPAQAPTSTQPSPRPPLTPALLTARLPNGVMVELQCGGQDVALVKAMIEALGAH